MQIHQFVHTLNYGDAISGEALAIARLLQQAGVSSRIYTLHVHEKLKDHSRAWESFQSDVDAGVKAGETVAVILHYSLASPLNDLFLALKGIKRAMIYHNLTPPQWFCRYNARVVRDLEQGREELGTFVRVSDILLADSEYNSRELLALGAEHCAVLPLPLDSKKWDIAANRGIASILKGHGGKNFLYVGRMAPNKCIDDVIKAFYFYHHKIEEKSRLWLIGSDVDTELYSFELRRLVAALHLKHAVTFVGAVADSELKSFYENSDAYLSMSEHEGFCVPLLEAMHFRLPVIAYNAGAVADTLAGSGLLLARKSPAETAELMNIVATDPVIRARLIEASDKRVKEFDDSHFGEHLRRLLLEPLQAKRPS